MSRASLSLAMLLLGGCYTAFRPDVTAPIGHGHGGAAVDFAVAAGGEYVGEHVRGGGGFALGMRAEDGGYAPVGVEGRIEVALSRPNDLGQRFVATGNAMIGYASGLPASQFAPGGPDGAIGQAFLGVGLAREMPPDRNTTAITIAFGALATRFVPDSGSAYWLVGAGLDMVVRWDVDHVMSGR
jgi:hypothetical protein